MRVPASVVEARREKLAQRVAVEGYLHLTDLCRKLGVSVATARRDLAHLHSRGRISRIRGGALHRGGVLSNPSQPGEGARKRQIRSLDESEAALFESQAARVLKESLCEAGRRAWLRGLVDGATGHLSVRFGDRVLSTPAGVSRGSMDPEMICMVDLRGGELAAHNPWRRSVEVTVDLAIYNAVPNAAAVIHAHSPHATAFAVSGLEPPRNLLPEFELFVGILGHADYRAPGSKALANLVGQLAPRHPSLLLKNHGVICWGTSTEDALIRLEMTEAYCQTASIAARLPGHLTNLDDGELDRLMEAKSRLGIPDSRLS